MNHNKIIPCIWFSTDGDTISKVVEYYKGIFGENFHAEEIISLGEIPSRPCKCLKLP